MTLTQLAINIDHVKGNTDTAVNAFQASKAFLVVYVVYLCLGGLVQNSFRRANNARCAMLEVVMVVVMMMIG